MTTWVVSWANDVDVNEDGDEAYREWFEVTDGSRIFRCDSSVDADWLAGMLRNVEAGL